jgi:uncharacterized membrane protein YgdD (TMEM256/DUF423 family)
VQYHFWHVLALLALALALPRLAPIWATTAGWLFIAGTLLFCGSLYGLALDAPRVLGLMTPIGGVALLFAWVALAIAALRG